MTKPSSCGLPDATNTGVPKGVALTVVQGDVTLRTAGQVYDAMDVRGCISVQAPNVTIKRTKVTCGGAGWPVSNKSGGSGLVIQDVEVDCANSQGTGIVGNAYTARRINAHGCENGFDVDGNVTVADSYIHDLWVGVDGHVDGIQVASGSTGIVFNHNTILNKYSQTSAIIGGDNTGVTVSDNLLAGGGYSLYCGGANFRAVDNRFSRLYWPNAGYYGPMANCDGIAQRSGNIWDDTGQAVS